MEVAEHVMGRVKSAPVRARREMIMGNQSTVVADIPKSGLDDCMDGILNLP